MSFWLQVATWFHFGMSTLFEPIFVQVVTARVASPPGQS